MANIPFLSYLLYIQLNLPWVQRTKPKPANFYYYINYKTLQKPNLIGFIHRFETLHLKLFKWGKLQIALYFFIDNFQVHLCQIDKLCVSCTVLVNYIFVYHYRERFVVSKTFAPTLFFNAL